MDAAIRGDVAGPTGAATSVSLAAVTWIANLEIILRIFGTLLTIAVASLTLYHYYNIYFRKKP
jgi:hypothetical protein